MATPIPDNEAAMTAPEVAAAVRGTLVRRGTEGESAVGFVSDSRAVRRGSAFVAIAGATVDGHRFLGEAVTRGASLLIVREGTALPETSGTGVVEVADTLVAWGDIARAHLRRWRSHSRTATVGITGSTGKTTTKELTLALLSSMGPCHGTAGNLNNRVGVPAVAFGVRAPARFAVFELGMSEPGEMAALAKIVEPDIAVLLNVGVAHAGGVGGSRQHVAREKGALLEAVGEDGTCVVNLDDEFAAAQVTRTPARIMTFGTNANADYRLVERTSRGPLGSRLCIERRGERLEVTLPLLGEGAALDFLAAFAATEAAGGQVLPLSLIEQALARCRAVGGRAALRRLGHDILAIDDTYNANPESMRAALSTLAEIGKAAGLRKVAVLGEMRELGAIAEAEHQALGEVVARAGVALAIGCGGLIDLTLDRAAACGVAVLRAKSTDEASELAAREVRAGDIVLLKGSRSIGVERVLGSLRDRHGDG